MTQNDGVKRVLVVEDEDLIRMLSTEMLVEAGYQVIEASSADEALLRLDEAHDVEVLFTDIRMPGSMNGIELAQLVHQRWPDIRLLLTSGDTTPTREQMPDDGQFVPKPYDLRSLVARVDRLVA